MRRESGSYISTMQGEWEGSTLDLVLSAMQAFPDAAFLGLFSFIRFLYTAASCQTLGPT